MAKQAVIEQDGVIVCSKCAADYLLTNLQHLRQDETSLHQDPAW